jgi:hypothetical protein
MQEWNVSSSPLCVFDYPLCHYIASIISHTPFLKNTYHRYSLEGSKSASDCTPCTDPGYYCSGGKREKCNNGTYTASDGSFCQQCMPGNQCEAGTGKSTPCSSGTYNDGTFTKCQPCAIGSYQDGVGSTYCKSCAPGSTTTTEGRKSCDKCPPGYFCIGSTKTICPAGSYCNEGSVSATICPLGLYSKVDGATSIASCLPCDKGFSCAGGKRTACSSGSYTSENGSFCEQCMPGNECDPKSGTSTPCAPGTYNDGLQSHCKPCESGTYQDSTGATFCRVCEPGLYSGANASECYSCPNGSACVGGKKKNCDPGTFTSRDGSYCEQCTRGFECDRFGNMTACPRGAFNNGTDYKCRPCPRGTAQGEEGQSSCQACSEGFFSNVTGLTQCYPCEAGFKCPFRSIHPQLCEDGKYSEKMASACLTCDGGYYCKGGRKIQCGAGWYAPRSSTVCIKCDLHYHCKPGSEEQVKCPVGYFCKNPWSDPQPCSEGKYCGESGQIAEEQCPPGFMCPTVTQKIACKTVGKYCPENSKEEISCGPGFVCDGGAVRAPCSPGWYCPDGVNQFKCPQGTFNGAQQAPNAQMCEKCPAYQTTEIAGSTRSSDCKCNRGYYVDDNVDNGGNRTCIECGEGLNCDGLNFKFDSITSKKGFYFNKNDTYRRGDKPAAVKCTPEDSCLDGSRCAEGYLASSPLCSICESNATARYYRSGSIQSPKDCQLCAGGNSANSQVLMMALAFLSGCGFLAFLVKKKIDSAQKLLATRNSASQYAQVNGNVTVAGTNEEGQIRGKSSTSVLQRAALNHLQIIGLLGRFNFRWSTPVKTFFSSTESLSAASVTSGFDVFSTVSVDGSIKCLLYSTSMPYPSNEMLVNVYNLGLMTLTVLIFWLIAGKGKPKASNVMISLIVLFYMSYSKILRSFFQLFDCTNLNGFFAELRLQGALDVKCSLEDDRYRTSLLILALPVTLLYLVPLPLLALWKLNRSDKGADHIVTVYGFLYAGYKKEYWYWEILVLVRKVLVAAISVFLSAEVSSANDLQVNSTQYQQGLLATLVVSVALYIQLKLEPFEGDELNGVESMGLVVSVVSLYLGLWTFYGKESYMIDTIITVLIFGINGCWFLYTLLSLFKEFKVVKYMESVLRFFTCRERKNKEGGMQGGKNSKEPKGGKVKSDIELPQIHISNPLMAVPEDSNVNSSRSLETVVGNKSKNKVKDLNGSGSTTKGSNASHSDARGAQKVMINPLNK